MTTVLSLKTVYIKERYTEINVEDVVKLTMLEDEGIIYNRHIYERVGEFVMICLN